MRDIENKIMYLLVHCTCSMLLIGLVWNFCHCLKSQSYQNDATLMATFCARLWHCCVLCLFFGIMPQNDAEICQNTDPALWLMVLVCVSICMGIISGSRCMVASQSLKDNIQQHFHKDQCPPELNYHGWIKDEIYFGNITDTVIKLFHAS
jgi:hypothetical protein